MSGVGFTCLSSTKQSPDKSQVMKASWAIDDRALIPVASRARFLSAQRPNSRWVRFCHCRACSLSMPSTSRSSLALNCKPTPITLVRCMLIADVAIGVDM